MTKKKLPHVNLYDIEKHCLPDGEENEEFSDAFHMVSVLPASKAYNRVVPKCSIHMPSRKRSIDQMLCTKHNRGYSIKTIQSERMVFHRKLDMHGMRVRTAYDAFMSFIQSAYYANVSAVLVITGKGKNSVGNVSVLKEAVLQWLTVYPFQEIVEWYGTPHRKYGGEGAIAIILKSLNRNKIIQWGIFSIAYI